MPRVARLPLLLLVAGCTPTGAPVGYEDVGKGFFEDASGQRFIRTPAMDPDGETQWVMREAPRVDLATFERVGVAYSRDAKRVYFDHVMSDGTLMVVVDGADPASLEVTAPRLAEDGHNVYDSGRPVPREPVQFDGSCAAGRPLGTMSDYRGWVRTLPGDGGFVRVRADASWPGENLDNVLGKVWGPTYLPASGPIKAEPSQGVGHAVPLEDGEGRRCKGYVSGSVVRGANSRRKAVGGAP